jgi:excisionase family DNA binding protein
MARGAAMTDELSVHVTVALEAHLERLRLNGRHPPRSVELLYRAYAAQSGTAVPEFDVSTAGLEGGCMPLLLEIDDAARMCGLGVRTVRKLTADGTIPSVLIGSSRRYKLEDVRKFVADLPHAEPKKDGN